jgi:hypothetical protein
LLFACRIPEIVSAHKVGLESLVNHLFDFLYSNGHPDEEWNLIAEGTLLLLSALERSRAPEYSKGTEQKSWIDLEDVRFIVEWTTSLEVLGLFLDVPELFKRKADLEEKRLQYNAYEITL